jgi:ATP-binding cassette subfamily B protein RaxB
MSFANNLAFGFRASLPLIMQAEATECGLACIAMIACYHGHHTDLLSLRRRFSVSLKGATLTTLIQVSRQLEFGTRPLKLDIDQLQHLRVPCILHWEFNHFVVLKAVNSRSIIIYDPALGVRVLPKKDVSKSFTGVALELWPTTDFKRKEPKQAVHLRSLIGRVSGLYSSATQVLTLALALEAFALVSPFFLQWVVDNAILSADRDLLATLAIAFCLLMMMQQALTIVRSWVLLYMSTTLNLQWRSNVFSHLIRLPVQYFEKRHLGDIVSRFSTTEVIQRTLTTSFLEAILDGVMTIATLIIMIVYSPILATVAVAAMLMYALVRWGWYRPLQRATEEQIVHAARQESHLLETIRGVKAIKMFQRLDTRSASWIALVVNQINAELRTSKLVLFYKFLNGLLFGTENILIVWLGARLVIEGSFSVGVLTAFIAYKGQFDGRVSALIDKYFEVKMLRLQGERLADIVLTEPETGEGAHKSPGSTQHAPSLIVRELHFRYSEHEPYVLDGVSFELPAGSSVAIVGPSGCGKTTLLNVLLGVLPAAEGEILIDGIRLEQLGVDQFRSMVGTVLQDDVLFAGSIAENICFFDPTPDHHWLVQCAQLASIADEIAQMPMGYNTLVGDMGTVLSGGQKQRVLLARALYKKPRILFLDEATSHLDIHREHQVNQAVHILNITKVIIAHRPETIASAGRVIVLQNGRVAYDGPVTRVKGNGEAEHQVENGSEPSPPIRSHNAI